MRPDIAGPDLRLAVEDAVRIRVVVHGRRPAPLGVVRHVVRDGGRLGRLFPVRRRPPALERIPRERGRGRQGADARSGRAGPLLDDALFRPKGDRVRLVVVVQRRVAAIREDVCAQLPLQMLRHPHLLQVLAGAECVITDVRHAVRNDNARQAAVLVERARVDGGHARWNRDVAVDALQQSRAVLGQQHAVPGRVDGVRRIDRDGDLPAKGAERLRVNVGDAGRDEDMFQFRKLPAIPQCTTGNLPAPLGQHDIRN